MFESDVKEEILIDKLRSLVTGGAMVSDAEIRQKFEKENTKIKFDYAVLRKDDILKEPASQRLGIEGLLRSQQSHLQQFDSGKAQNQVRAH